MTCGCEASISDKDPRADIWRAALGKTSIPIVWPLYVSNPSFPGRGFLQGDSTALTDAQKEMMADLISQKFNLPAVEVLHDLTTGPFPILDEHVTVTFCKDHSRMMR